MNRFFDADHPSIVRIHEQLEHLVTWRNARRLRAARWKQLRQNQLAGFMTGCPSGPASAQTRDDPRIFCDAGRRHRHPDAMAFADAIPFEEEHIAKVAPALPAGGTLLVTVAGAGFDIWGLGRGRQMDMWTVSLDVSEPGVIRVGAGPYQPFAVSTVGWIRSSLPRVPGCRTP